MIIEIAIASILCLLGSTLGGLIASRIYHGKEDFYESINEIFRGEDEI